MSYCVADSSPARMHSKGSTFEGILHPYPHAVSTSKYIIEGLPSGGVTSINKLVVLSSITVTLLRSKKRVVIG